MTRSLSEAESKRVLAQLGVPVVEERLVTTVDAAVDAGDELGYPVVVKACAPGLSHKTEHGLVRLGLGDAQALRTAAEGVLDAARALGPADLLVAPMVRGSRELIAGMHVDEQFGPCVMLGLGGVAAEALADVTFRLVPLSEADAQEMPDDLRSRALLDEFRGEPAVDRAALTRVLLALSALAEQDAAVVAADVNPLVVVDGLPVAVDALVEVRE